MKRILLALFALLTVHQVAFAVSASDWISDNAGESNSVSTATYTFTTNGYSYLSFDWEVGSESNFDFLTIMLDDEIIIYESGINSGSFSKSFYDYNQHKLVIQYAKDGSMDSNGDYAKVYNIYGSGMVITNVSAPVDITINTPGTLESIIGNQKSTIRSLKIHGEINAADMLYIHSIVSEFYLDYDESIHEWVTRPSNQLESLDLGDAALVESYAETTIDGKRYSYTIDPIISLGTIIGIHEDGQSYSSQSMFGYNNKSLRSIILPMNLKIIDSFAFASELFTSIILPSSLEEIKYEAFENTSIKTISIPKSLKRVEYGIFTGCNELEEIIVEPGNMYFNPYNNGNALVGYDGTLYAGCNKSNIANLNIKKIGWSAFHSLNGITSLVLPDELEEIDGTAFYGCRNLKTIHFNQKLKSINLAAFRDCEQLTDINLPESLDSLGTQAFSGCSLSEVFIPKNVKWYGKCLKSSLPWITYNSIWWNHKNGYYEYTSPFDSNVKISVSPDNPYLDSRENCNGVVETKTNTFIGGYVGGFIPEGILHISEDALEDCDTNVLPSSVKSVDLTNLRTYFKDKVLYCLAKEPPTITSYFYDCYTEYDMPTTIYPNATLYVHSKSLSAYKNDVYWSQFSEILPIEPSNEIYDDIPEYANEAENDYDIINYTRTFANTNWQAIYVPFCMSYADWSKDFEVARINDAHQWDDDDDGIIDRTQLEVIKIKSGWTEPNTPYLIRAKSVGEKVITVKDATLYKTEENTFDVTSWNTKFSFTGTYKTISGTDMKANGYYAMSNGKLVQAASTSSDLNPFRWYLDVTDRDGNKKNVNEVKICVFGDDEEFETDVDLATENGKKDENVFDLSGRKVINAKAGIYVKNGKKYVVK